MFNMEGSSGTKKDSSGFDLEADMKDLTKSQMIKQAIDDKIRMLSIALREGEEKESFEKKQLLLDGYLALQKVLNRINRRFV